MSADRLRDAATIRAAVDRITADVIAHAETITGGEWATGPHGIKTWRKK